MNDRLHTFVSKVQRALGSCAGQAQLLAEVQAAMARLVAVDDWLPAAVAQPHPQYYQQYLLYRDPSSRFCVVSFVWGPGQQTPIHDHTVWGVIGMLRGEELAQHYRCDPDGITPEGPEERLCRGEVAAVSPRTGDIHRVRNAFGDRVSISVHVYGADIGVVRRHVFDAVTGATKEFVSGYSVPAGSAV